MESVIFQIIYGLTEHSTMCKILCYFNFVNYEGALLHMLNNNLSFNGSLDVGFLVLAL